MRTAGLPTIQSGKRHYVSYNKSEKKNMKKNVK